MSREAYQAPTLISDPTAPASQQQGAGSPGGTGTGTGTINAHANGYSYVGTSTADRGTSYTCGDCNSKVLLKRGDAVRCKECGYRVMYKERTNRMVQFEAR